MKKLLAMSCALMMPVMAMAGVEGVWQTEPNDEGVSGLVQISACGDAYCGVMIGNTAGTDKYQGVSIIAGMSSSDGVNFSGGTITDPTKNKQYDAKMSLNGDVLKVSGCVLGGVICDAQNWMRAQ